MDIWHVLSERNVVTEALSNIEELRAAVDYKVLKPQNKNAELKTILSDNASLQLELLCVPGTHICLSITCQ